MSPAFLAGFFLHATLFCQPDSATGVIVLKRPPVAAQYAFKATYNYGEKWNKKRFWERRYTGAVRTYKAWLSPPSAPVPVSAGLLGDSLFVLKDSAKIANNFLGSNTNPAHVFDWDSCLNLVNYKFEWSDSMQLDSARFIFNVDKKGRTVFISSPFTSADSSSFVLQEKAKTVLRNLWLWFPARGINNRNSQLMNIDCTVELTIYAFGIRNSAQVDAIVQSQKKKK